jgi:hypothetical protein
MCVKYIAVGLLAVLLVSRLMSKSPKTGFGNLGLVCGMALGLSASPVLAATITAIFTLAGVLVPIYLGSPRAAGESEGSLPGDPQRWLGPLASWLALGLIVGIFLRVNDALNFSENLRSRYQAQGFNDSEINTIMAGVSTTLAKQTPGPAGEQDRTNLQAQERPENWAKLLADLVRPNDPPETNLARVKNAVGKDDLKRIHSLEARGMSAREVLEALKTWHLSKER